MNIFWREIKAHFKGLIGWSAGVVFTVVSGMAKFEGYSTEGGKASINLIIEKFPKPLLVLFGMNGLDLTTLVGYFGVLYLYIVLVLAIHAGLLGAEIISKEERDKTSEFLFPKPVSRIKVLNEKLLAAVVNILFLTCITSLTSIWIVGFYNKNYDLNNQVLLLMSGVLMFQLLSFAFGAFFAGIFKNPKLPTVAITTLITSSYLVAVVTDLNSNLEFLKYLTPFKYFGADKIIAEGRLDSFYLMLAAIFSITLIILTYIFYKKRDLTV